MKRLILQAAIDSLSGIEEDYEREAKRAEGLMRRIKDTAPKDRPKGSLATATSTAQMCRNSTRQIRQIKRIILVGTQNPDRSGETVERYVRGMRKFLDFAQTLGDKVEASLAQGKK